MKTAIYLFLDRPEENYLPAKPTLPAPVSDATFMDVTPDRNEEEERDRGRKNGLGHRTESVWL